MNLDPSAFVQVLRESIPQLLSITSLQVVHGPRVFVSIALPLLAEIGTVRTNLTFPPTRPSNLLHIRIWDAAPVIPEEVPEDVARALETTPSDPTIGCIDTNLLVEFVGILDANGRVELPTPIEIRDRFYLILANECIEHSGVN